MDSSDSDSDSYAGSAASVAAIQDLSEVKVAEQIERAFDPLPLDRAMVVETQHSGLLNAVTQDLARQLQELQAATKNSSEQQEKWQSLLKKTEANVEWLRTRVSRLVAKEKAGSPIEFAQAESLVVFREDYT